MKLFLTLICIFSLQLSFARMHADSIPEFVSNTIMVKVLPDHSNSCRKNDIAIPKLHKILSKFGEVTMTQLFTTTSSRSIDLSLIYEIIHTEGNTDQLIKALNDLAIFVYAEPKVINYIDFIPNDSFIGNQWYLDTIKAYQAWDIEQGDTNVVIGIVDTGIDIDHEDLSGAIKYNYNDPIDGLDNDNDGFIDNYRGWDLSDNDSNPQEPAEHQHGTSVAGCTTPVTNNGKGIAGAGYKCKILPIKAAKNGSSATTGLDKGFEGIAYAADHGAKIINCSWGSSYASKFGKDIIDYAVSKGCLVVAAAGNTSSDAPHYPAAFTNVLGVANTFSSDVLASTSGRGYWIDLCAPGSNIYTTFDGDNYNYNSGTSYAAPIAASCAALVLSKYPASTPQQLKERLKSTCDNIGAISGNEFYKNQLGDGRINLYNAITATNLPSIIVSDYLFADDKDNKWQSNDTISVQVTFTNVLDSTGGLTAELNSTSVEVNIIDSTFDLGSLKTNESIANLVSKFKFSVLPTAPFNARLEFTIDIKNTGGYVRTIPFVLDVNNYYVDVTINDLWMTVSSDGQIGYYDENQAAGIGIKYQQSNSLLFESSFMVGIPSKVVDMTRGLGSTNDNDFIPIAPAIAKDISEVSNKDVSGMFSDSIANAADKLNIKVKHHTYAWNKTGHMDYIIQEYTLINTGSSTLDSVYAGVFADWDIGSANNIIASETTKKFGYCYEPDNNLYAGIKELTHWRFVHHAMYNNVSDGAGIHPNSSFTSNKKYAGLSTFEGWAGWGTGQDVSHIVSTGPFFINAGDSVKVAFAIMAGNSLDDLIITADSANIQYNGKLISAVDDKLKVNFSVSPNPFSEQLLISTDRGGIYKLIMTNSLGQIVLETTFDTRLSLHRKNISNGLYFITIKDDDKVVLQSKIVVN